MAFRALWRYPRARGAAPGRAAAARTAQVPRGPLRAVLCGFADARGVRIGSLHLGASTRSLPAGRGAARSVAVPRLGAAALERRSTVLTAPHDAPPGR